MRLPGFERKQATSESNSPRIGTKSSLNDDLSLNFIVITADEQFYSTLQQIAGTSEWRIGRSESVGQVDAMIKAKPTPMVVYDRDSTDDNWRDAVRHLSDLPVHPCVLLASRVADNYLLEEVVRNHGYDILPKSVTKDKLIQHLRFAWSWARTRGQTRR